MADLSVKLGRVALDNPVIPASGTFGYGHEFAELYDINCLGALVIKGTTEAPRFGNPQPRIAECAEGLLNSVGLQNPGAAAVIQEELPRLRRCFHKPVIANICGFSVEEYARTAALFDREPGVAILEINISCPNVSHGGMSFGTDPCLAAEVTREVRAVTKKPLFIKLSPNAADVAAVARACEGAGADGISLINTLLAMRIDLRSRRPLLANTTGGLSGPAVFPVALRMVYQVYEAVRIPIMGMGGVQSAEDVIEMLLAGASAVQVGAANLTDPFACRRIAAELPAAMEKYGITKLSEITGGAHHG